MHIESSKLGFYISLFENNNAIDKPTADVEVSITELSGEVNVYIIILSILYT